MTSPSLQTIRKIGMTVGGLSVVGSLFAPSTGTDRDSAVDTLFTLGIVVIVGSAFATKKPRVALWLYGIAAALGLLGPLSSGALTLLLWPAVYAVLAWLTHRARPGTRHGEGR